MRRLNKQIVILLAGGMMLFIALIYINRPKPTKLSCDASFILHKDGHVLKLLMSYIFYDNNGIAMLNGAEVTPEGVTHTVNRRTVFTYAKVNNSYSLTSTNSYSMPNQAENTVFSELMPAFYFKKDINFNIVIYPQGDEGWVFAAEPVPSFLCEKR